MEEFGRSLSQSMRSVPAEFQTESFSEEMRGTKCRLGQTKHRLVLCITVVDQTVGLDAIVVSSHSHRVQRKR